MDPVDPDLDPEHWNIQYHSYRMQSSEFKVRYLRIVFKINIFLIVEWMDITTGVQEITANMVMDSFNKVASPLRKSRKESNRCKPTEQDKKKMEQDKKKMELNN